MREKTVTTKAKSSRSKPRARSSASRVVTGKADGEQVKRALARRAKRQTKTELMDHAVPESAWREGIAPAYASTAKPSVLKQPQSLSPFILSLKAIPNPQELLEESERRSLRVDFLSQQAPQSPQRMHDPAHDLLLSPLDVLTPIKQGPLQDLPKPNFIFPRPHHSALRHDSPSLSSFSCDAFIPHELPKDIFSYFDFPEEEGLVGLERLVGLEGVDLELPEPEEKRAWLPAIPRLAFFIRPIASFIGLSFVLVLPLHAMNVVNELRETKSRLETAGVEAGALLSAGAQAALAQDVAGADSQFNAAGTQFQNAKQTIADLGAGTTFLLSILPLTQASYQSGSSLVEAGQELAIAGSRLVDGFAAMEQELSPTPISRLNILEAYLTSTVPHLQAAQEALAQVDLEVVPEAHRSTLTDVQLTLPALLSTIKEFESLCALAKELLGADGTKRYLIVFQNNTEIRPTGGFIGSFAEIKVRDGVIEHLAVPGGGSYDLQGTLQENLRAPEPLQLLSARWEFQDGNWFPDFPTSARQLMQFYTDAGGPSVDGVLAVNATFISKLIGLLGPIEMQEYGRIIDEENFIFEAQKIVEVEYDKQENTPKAFIGDLAPLLVERTIEKTTEDFLTVVDYVGTGLVSKDLQLYLTNQDLQRHILEQGWGGEMKQTVGDYLMVVDTNLGGGKTDGVIQQNIDLQIEIAGDGTITNTLTISRTHFGIQGLLFTGVNNVDFVRVYVPQGSTLLEAHGFSIPDQSLFEIPDEEWTIDDDLAYGLLTTTIDPVSGTMVSQEHGKTVFGNWVQTMPGSTSTATFRYQLPFTVKSLEGNVVASLKSLIGLPQTETYSLLVQKQPGILDRTTNVHVSLPENLNALWASHDPAATELSNATDGLFAILLESN